MQTNCRSGVMLLIVELVNQAFCAHQKYINKIQIWYRSALVGGARQTESTRVCFISVVSTPNKTLNIYTFLTNRTQSCICFFICTS
jgi:hypothetical protein